MVGGSSTMPMVLVMLFLAMNSANLLVHAISCDFVTSQMLPCLEFLTGDDHIDIPCCWRAKYLNRLANIHPQERTSLCQCLKQGANLFRIDVRRAQQIPQLCHIHFATGLIDPDQLDCNKLNPTTPQTSRLAPSSSPSPSSAADSPHSEGEKMKPNRISDPPIISSSLAQSLPRNIE